MIFRNTHLITSSALAALLTLGVVSNVSAGHRGYGYGYGYNPSYGHGGYHGHYRGYGMPGRYGYGRHSGAPMKGFVPHPVLGVPVPMGGGHGKAYGKGGSCGDYGRTGYLMKTGMAESKKTADTAPTGDIVDVAVGAGSFSTLVAAVKAAGLVETLKGEGPFTVFAPTDEAFAKIDKAALDALLADKEKLTAVLTYHVVPGKVVAADVAKIDSAKTVQGGTISIDTSDGVKVDGANVVKTDVVASNGVIHVIDTVILPK
jgi:uncharacterized surface protein with fasciclin (FAS1) repeats